MSENIFVIIGSRAAVKHHPQTFYLGIYV